MTGRERLNEFIHSLEAVLFKNAVSSYLKGMDKSRETSKIQEIQDGCGPKYHRKFRIRLRSDFASAKKIMKSLMKDPNSFSPQLLAKFEKIKSHGNTLSQNDEFQIHLPGPWNGPVRVSEVSDCEFHLVTLEGHLEAGEISFKLQKTKNDSEVIFEIESLARSRDQLVDLVYDKLPLVKMVQTEMWTCFCENFAERTREALKDHDEISKVQILTEKFDEASRKWRKA